MPLRIVCKTGPMSLVLVWAIMLPMAQAAAGPPELLLADRGQAQLPIVIAEKVTDGTRQLARELAGYLSRISGARFEIQTGDGSRGIVLGTLADFPHPELATGLEVQRPGGQAMDRRHAGQPRGDRPLVPRGPGTLPTHAGRGREVQSARLIMQQKDNRDNQKQGTGAHLVDGDGTTGSRPHAPAIVVLQRPQLPGRVGRVAAIAPRGCGARRAEAGGRTALALARKTAVIGRKVPGGIT